VVHGWMNVGAMVEWYWQEKTEVLREKHYTAWVVDEWVDVEHWWNDTDRGKLKYWEKIIIQRGWYMDGWVWSNGGIILTGENWSTGRKTLYSVGGSWMNEYGQNVGMIMTGENWSIVTVNYLVSLCPQQISHGLARYPTVQEPCGAQTGPLQTRPVNTDRTVPPTRTVTT